MSEGSLEIDTPQTLPFFSVALVHELQCLRWCERSQLLNPQRFRSAVPGLTFLQ